VRIIERALAFALRAFSEVITRFLADLILAKVNSYINLASNFNKETKYFCKNSLNLLAKQCTPNYPNLLGVNYTVLCDINQTFNQTQNCCFMAQAFKHDAPDCCEN
jgi:hypothetical protein